MPCLPFCVCERRATNLPESLGYIMLGVMGRIAPFASCPAPCMQENQAWKAH